MSDKLTTVNESSMDIYLNIVKGGMLFGVPKNELVLWALGVRNSLFIDVLKRGDETKLVQAVTDLMNEV